MADKNIIENVPGTTSKDSTNNTTSSTPGVNIDDSLAKITLKLQTINTLREELIKLELNPEGRLYFNNDIAPLLTVLYQLASTSVDLSTSVNILSSSYLVKPNKSKLKDTFKLVYDINEQCDDVYRLLAEKIEVLINISCKPK